MFLKRVVCRAFLVGLIGAAAFGVTLIAATKSDAATDDVTLSTSVQEYLSFSITSGDTVAFGNLTPGTPLKGSAGTATSVTTNTANGYTLAVSDAIAAANSALLHTDAATRIADYAGTIAVPTSWTGTGLGFSLYSGTNKDVKWGTGTTYDDANNKYAGVPETATTIMTKTGYSAGADTAGIGWEVDVANTQKTGGYSGSATLTVTGVLS